MNERLTIKMSLYDYNQTYNNSLYNVTENLFNTVNLLMHYEDKSVCNISKLESNLKSLGQND